MTGAFPSISWKTSASASSPVFSLYFFLASSPSAALNSSNVMVREDFFLKCSRVWDKIWCTTEPKNLKRYIRLNCFSRDQNTALRFVCISRLLRKVWNIKKKEKFHWLDHIFRTVSVHKHQNSSTDCSLYLRLLMLSSVFESSCHLKNSTKYLWGCYGQ